MSVYNETMLQHQKIIKNIFSNFFISIPGVPGAPWGGPGPPKMQFYKKVFYWTGIGDLYKGCVAGDPY